MYKPVNRSFTKEYLELQHKTMRWLAEKGITKEEIQALALGNIDEDTREVIVTRKRYNARYYDGIQRVYVDQW